MNRQTLEQLLADVAAGRLAVGDAIGRLGHLPFEDIEFARIDHHRHLRCGFPEVIFGQGKTSRQIEEIFARLAAAGSDVLATRVRPHVARRVTTRFPQSEHNRLARTVSLRQNTPPASSGFIGIVCAGTADMPVAEEARVTAEMMGQRVRTFYDVGVAGLHRLLADLSKVRAANVLVVVAGMEGALPSVVGGLVDCPVIAVPTSVGYGANLQGIAPLLTMLNTCAPGVSVVNIDNGFGGAYQATMINRLAQGGDAGAASDDSGGSTSEMGGGTTGAAPSGDRS